MEDNEIIDLYWDRDETAISHTQQKYGAYCTKIANNILYEKEDSLECVNDTWLKAWNSMPQERPNLLAAFLGAITRHLSLDRYRRKHAGKRGKGEAELIFDEMQDTLTSDGPEQQIEALQLTAHINLFLDKIGKENRMIFVRRYWYMDSVKDIAKRYEISESKVKSSLLRSRKKLPAYLAKEGYVL